MSNFFFFANSKFQIGIFFHIFSARLFYSQKMVLFSHWISIRVSKKIWLLGLVFFGRDDIFFSFLTRFTIYNTNQVIIIFIRLECLKSETVSSMMGDFAWNLATLSAVYVLTWNGMMRVDLTSSKCEEIKFVWDKFGGIHLAFIQFIIALCWLQPSISRNVSLVGDT